MSGEVLLMSVLIMVSSLASCVEGGLQATEGIESRICSEEAQSGKLHWCELQGAEYKFKREQSK